MIAAALFTLTAITQSVTFSISAPEAKEVLMAGDYMGWTTPKKMTKEKGRWSTTLNLEPESRFEYKFVVDGKWIVDPNNPKKSGGGLGVNSVYEGPKYEPHTNEGTPIHPLTRQLFNLGGRDVIVYKPDETAGLPILVYGDGENYEGVAKIQNVVANLLEAKKIRPVILVLIPPVDRLKEYGNGWKEYADRLFNTWLPAVRTATGGSSDAKDLYLGGSSMGGVISLRLAEEFPDKVSGGVHSQSGAFIFDSLGLDFHELADLKNLRKIAKGTRLWFCWGQYEGGLTKANQNLIKTLREMSVPYGSAATAEGHNWTAWRNRMEEGLIYLLRP